MSENNNIKTGEFSPYPYDEMPTVKMSFALREWREQHSVADSQSLLLVNSGPSKEELCALSPLVDRKVRESENTLLPVCFKMRTDFGIEDLRVYLSEVLVLSNPRYILFSGKMQTISSDVMKEVHGEYNARTRQGVLHCFG